MKLQSNNTTCIKYYVSRSQKILRKNLVVAFLEQHKESMNIDKKVRPYSYKGVGIMRLLFIGIQNFLSGCGIMALLILWGLHRRLKEIERENTQR